MARKDYTVHLNHSRDHVSLQLALPLSHYNNITYLQYQCTFIVMYACMCSIKYHTVYTILTHVHMIVCAHACTHYYTEDEYN